MASLTPGDDAIAANRRALALDPQRHDLREALITMLLDTGAQDHDAAVRDEIIRLIAEAIIQDGGRGMWPLILRSKLLQRDLERMTGLLRCAIERNPCDPLLLDNYSILQKEAQQWDEAERAARLACQQAPDNTRLWFHLGLLLLVRGNFDEGFRAYEQRWDEALRGIYPNFTQPRWRGEPLAGRTLLLWGEQGMGDLLLGSRYVPMLAQRVHREGGRLVWNVLPSSENLLARSFHGHYDVFCMGGPVEALPPHDLEVALLSLPFLLGTREDTIPCATRYLFPDPAAAAHWRERVAGERRLKVGIAWMGGPHNNRNEIRSVGLAAYARHFAPLADKVAFYSLQPNAADDIAAARAEGFDVIDYSAQWQTFDDTAAFIDALDLVITVCTSIAHLAGGLGQRAWVLLDANPYWVWQLERRDSPWYPTVTLYRQQTTRVWDGVLDEVAKDLAALA